LTDDGAGADAGAVVELVAVIVTPDGAPEAKLRLATWPFEVAANGAVPPDVGTATDVAAGAAEGVGVGAGDVMPPPQPAITTASKKSTVNPKLRARHETDFTSSYPLFILERMQQFKDR
jgi:hypothetical protein